MGPTKFPKTPRLAAVMREDLDRWRRLVAVVEEKVDGANVGLWCDGGRLLLRSRQHELVPGGDPLFEPFHEWAAGHEAGLVRTLGDRYMLYGEWCAFKNKAYYDALPDWFLGYDLLDRTTGEFLAGLARRDLLAASGVEAVPMVWFGTFGKAGAFDRHIGLSRLKTHLWRTALAQEARLVGVSRPMDGTDDSDAMEGVYIRIEDGPRLVGRMKLHREGYSKVHDTWGDRPLIRNRRAPR